MKKYNRSKSYDPEILDKLHAVHIQILTDFINVCRKHNLDYFVAYGTAIGAVRHKGFIPWDDDVDVAMLREDYEKFLQIFSQELDDKYNLLTPEKDSRYACTVTHLQRKGTVFVSETSKNLKCEQCIYIDIFPLDYVAKGRIRSFCQGLSANFWGKLLFLAGSSEPVILYNGILGELMSIGCKCIHFGIKILHLSPRILYQKHKKAATRYNFSKKRSKFVTSFEYMGGLKDKIVKNDIFPLKEVPFENIKVNIPKNNHEFLSKVYGDYMKIPEKAKQINHMPLVIKFEGESPIYR